MSTFYIFKFNNFLNKFTVKEKNKSTNLHQQLTLSTFPGSGTSQYKDNIRQFSHYSSERLTTDYENAGCY